MDYACACGFWHTCQNLREFCSVNILPCTLSQMHRHQFQTKCPTNFWGRHPFWCFWTVLFSWISHHPLRRDGTTFGSYSKTTFSSVLRNRTERPNKWTLNHLSTTHCFPSNVLHSCMWTWVCILFKDLFSYSGKSTYLYFWRMRQQSCDIILLPVLLPCKDCPPSPTSFKLPFHYR